VLLWFKYACDTWGAMADNSAIEWTDATWNPVTGCTKITRGCDHCYAERFAERFRGVSGHPFEAGFDLTLRPARLAQPLGWRRPRRIFVNSMSDLFHKEIPSSFVDQVFDTMEKADWHLYQVLTKRSSLMRDYLESRYGSKRAPEHIWCGVSVEDSKARARVSHLREAPASIRFLSVEPLLGPIGEIDLHGIDWVIVGGESGPGARPMDVRWVRAVRDQCIAQGVAFFFKQWGGIRPKSGGRELDGREWSEFPVLRCQPPLAAE
jgi:protein gp37